MTLRKVINQRVRTFSSTAVVITWHHLNGMLAIQDDSLQETSLEDMTLSIDIHQCMRQDAPKGFLRLKMEISMYNILCKIYWSKVLTDQQGLCRFFRKHKIVKNLKTATIKHVIIHLSNLTKCFFRKKSLCNFLVKKNGKYPTQIRAFNFTTVDYPVYWTFNITLSPISFD